MSKFNRNRNRNNRNNNRNNNYRRNRTKRTRNNTLTRTNLPIEMKALTQTYHHFQLDSLANCVYSDSNVASGWTCLNLIPQGTTANSRNGSQVILTNIDLKISFYAPTASPDSARIMIIRDLGARGTIAPLNEIFDNTANNLTCIGPDCRRQYKLLKDIILDIGGAIATKTIHFEIRKRIRTFYFGSTATLASVENNPIYIFIFSIMGLNTTQVLNYAQVVNYVDI